MKIALIGCGNMGSSLAKHMSLRASLTLHDRNEEKGKKLAQELGAFWANSSQEAVRDADWVILAVKPKDLSVFKEQISLKKEQVLFSLLAGTPLSLLRKVFEAPTLIRMMPNLAVTIGKGIIGFSEEKKLDTHLKDAIQDIFFSFGLLLWIPEAKMDAFASLAASSPAFCLVAMEAMIEAGVSFGFSFQEAKEIVAQVFAGSAGLVQESSLHPAELKMQIASPGGTTIAGLLAFDACLGRKAFADALEASYLKGESLSRG